MTSPPPRPTREYKIGEKVEAAPKPKLVVRPSHWVDGPNNSPKGVFRNGGNKR